MDLASSKTYREDTGRALASVVSLGTLKESSVLVTGATGTIGSFLCDMLSFSGLGIQVYALGRNRERLEELFKGRASVNISVQDLDEELSLPFKADYIIHAAGNAFPAAFKKDPAGTLVSSVLGTKRLLDYALGAGTKRFLYISSGEVYGSGLPRGEEFREDMTGSLSPSDPRSSYPFGKIAAENLASSYTAMHNLETVSCRLCHTFGPVFSEKDNRAAAEFLSRASRKEDLVLRSLGLPYRSWAYIADTASAVLSVLTSGKSGEAYNIANPSSRATIREFAETVAAEAGVRVFIEMEGAQKVHNQVLCTEKLEALGWKGSYTLREGVRHALSILREAKEGEDGKTQA